MSLHTYKDAINLGAIALNKTGIERNVSESRILLAHVLGVSLEILISRPTEQVKADEFEQFTQLINRRVQHEPVAYLVGKKEFYGLEFFVDKNVLIPRPDSETLVEWILNNYANNPKIEILELGVGSGCLLLTILKHIKNASGVAVDISSESIKVAQKNYKNLGLINNITWLDCGWAGLPSFAKQFDLIISNPPYIAEYELKDLQIDVKNYEPRIALCGGLYGWEAYEEIAPIIFKNLKEEGVAVLEIGKGQEAKVEEIMKTHNLQLITKLRDLSANTRILTFKRR